MRWFARSALALVLSISCIFAIYDIGASSPCPPVPEVMANAYICIQSELCSVLRTRPSGFQIRFSPLLPTRQGLAGQSKYLPNSLPPSLPPCLDPAAAGLRDSAHVPPYILAKAFGDNGNFLKHQRRPSEAAEEMAAMAARQNGAKK